MSTRVRRYLPALVVLPLLWVGACSSSKNLNQANLRPCCCGTSDGDILGCTDACAAGAKDCGNPLCTCDHAGTKAARTHGAPQGAAK